MSKLPPPPDYDDNPEWTEADFARARPAAEVLPPEVLAALRRPATAVPTDERRDGISVAAGRQRGGAQYVALAA